MATKRVKATESDVNEGGENQGGEDAKRPLEEAVSIDQIDRKGMDLAIRGTSTLITHRFDEKTKTAISDKQTGKGSSGRKVKDPVEEFERARYLSRDENGNEVECIPAAAIKKALMAAGTLAGRMGKKVGMSIFVKGDANNGDLCILRDANTRKPIKGMMREDAVRVGPYKTADLRNRPEYVNWRVHFKVEYNGRAVTSDQLINYLNLAGFSVGLCEMRPEKGGNDHGRFEIALD